MGVFVKHLSTARKGMPISFLCGILGFASVLIIIFYGHENRAALSTVLKLSVLSIVLLSIIIFYILSQHEKVKEQPYFYTVFIVTYIGSLLLILITKDRPEMTLWMAGGLIIAMFFNMYLGYMVTFSFIFFASFADGLELEFIVYLLILGTLMCMFSGYMKKVSTLGYTVVIILSLQLILIFIINNFILKNSLNIAAVYSLVSSLLSIGFSYGVYKYYIKKANLTLDNPMKEQDKKQKVIQNDKPAIKQKKLKVNKETDSENPIAQDEVSVDHFGVAEWNMDEILDLEFPLLQRLREYSMKVYKHSLLIGELSKKAAKAVGADELKAQAGGLYHEIGRIENKEYVEEGVKLAEAYHLPNIIADIIRQHNIKYEKPKSPEAAIVMITISIMATREYLEKVEKKPNENQQETSVPIEKIVDNVFQMRLTKGSLDESGLTLKQYNKLKEFFLRM
jgi:cyclic-di-AMP phosphodiesterase PgpH